jgi:hypothetical protein
MGDPDEGNGPAHLTHPALALRLTRQVARTHGAARRCRRLDPARGRRMRAVRPYARCTKGNEMERRGRVWVHSGDVGASLRRNRACAARGRRCPGARTTLWSATQRRRRLNSVFEITKLQKASTNFKISKNKSCRGALDLQLSQRVSYVLINRFVGKSC